MCQNIYVDISDIVYILLYISHAAMTKPAISAGCQVSLFLMIIYPVPGVNEGVILTTALRGVLVDMPLIFIYYVEIISYSRRTVY